MNKKKNTCPICLSQTPCECCSILTMKGKDYFLSSGGNTFSSYHQLWKLPDLRELS